MIYILDLFILRKFEALLFHWPLPTLTHLLFVY